MQKSPTLFPPTEFELDPGDLFNYKQALKQEAAEEKQRLKEMEIKSLLSKGGSSGEIQSSAISSEDMGKIENKKSEVKANGKNDMSK